MKYRIKTDNLIKLIIIILGACLLAFSVFFIINVSVNHLTNEKSFINIGYNPTGVKSLDKKVKQLINKEKKAFLDSVNKPSNSSCERCNFVLDEDIHKYQGIYYVQIHISRFFDDDSSDKKTYTYIYDSKKDRFITLSDILVEDSGFEKFSLIIKHYLRKYAVDNKITIDDKLLTENSYNNYYLSSRGITILFLPHESFNNSDNVIEITIPWEKTNEFIKTKYQSKELQLKKSSITRMERDLTSFNGQKLVAFTFDDGPNEKTTKILLDNLSKYDAKVTFFVLGSRVDKNKEILKRAYMEGNDIGSHTFNHKELTTLKDPIIKKEIDDTNNKIEHILGVEPIYIRPPYGSINSHIKSMNTMHTICWNVDSIDWKTKNRKKIKQEIIKNVRDGSIVLVHDIYEESVYGALLAMNELKQKGYSFVTITEMAKLKNIVLDYDKTYYGF